MGDVDQKVEGKSNNLKLVIVFSVLFVVIIGLLVAIFLTKNVDNTEISVDDNELASLSESVTKWLYDDESEINIDEVAEKLQNILENSGDQDEQVQAAIYLSQLYGEQISSEAVLKTALEEDLSLENRYLILSSLNGLYVKYNDSAGRQWALSELLKLPDEEVLAFEQNWSIMRPILEEELNSMKGECENAT